MTRGGPYLPEGGLTLYGLRMARASIGMVRGGLCLTSDGLSMLTRVGICLEVVRGCLRLSDVSGGVGGWTCLTRRHGGQECGVEWR